MMAKPTGRISARKAVGALARGIVAELYGLPGGKPSPAPRCLDKAAAAAYLSVGLNTIERLINAQKLPIVRLPVENTRTGEAKRGHSRRVLIDVRDLDALIDRAKEFR